MRGSFQGIESGLALNAFRQPHESGPTLLRPLWRCTDVRDLWSAHSHTHAVAVRAYLSSALSRGRASSRSLGSSIGGLHLGLILNMRYH